MCKAYLQSIPCKAYFVLFFASSDVYFIGHLAFLTLSKPFEAERVAVSINMCAWVLKSVLATVSGKRYDINEHDLIVIYIDIPRFMAAHESAE